MDYQKFNQYLPEKYHNWGQSSVSPKSAQFPQVIKHINAMTTANIMQLLNWAVECLEEDEIYCEIGCFQGSTLIGALLNHPKVLAYAVDNLSEFEKVEDNLEKLSQNLIKFGVDEQVIFCNQEFEEFFFELREYHPKTKIGVYFYDGAHDYRSQLIGLLSVIPFLAEQALIIVDDANWSAVQQANWDFLALYPQAQLILELSTPQKFHHSFWNGIHVLSWDINRQSTVSWPEFSSQYRDSLLIKNIYDFQLTFEEQTKPHLIRKWYDEAAQLKSQKEFQAAEKRYQLLFTWEKHLASFWFDLTELYEMIGATDKAIEAVEQAINIEMNQAKFYYKKGHLLEQAGKTQQAIKAYQQTNDIDPKFELAYDRLYENYLKVDNLEEAENICRKALHCQPLYLLKLRDILIKQNKGEEARELSELVQIIYPERKE